MGAEDRQKTKAMARGTVGHHVCRAITLLTVLALGCSARSSLQTQAEREAGIRASVTTDNGVAETRPHGEQKSGRTQESTGSRSTPEIIEFQPHSRAETSASSRIVAPSRIVAIGDIHGDLRRRAKPYMLRSFLTLKKSGSVARRSSCKPET
jgi:hypothetical protein